MYHRGGRNTVWPKRNKTSSPRRARKFPRVSVEEVAERRRRGEDFILLDVREKDEVRSGTSTARSRATRLLEFQIAGKVPQTDQDIVVYCAGGARSLLAAKAMREMGYNKVSSMAGGITRWKDVGKEVVRDRS